MTDFLLDIAKIVGALTVIVGGLVAAVKWRATRWVIHRLVTDPAKAKAVGLVRTITDPIAADLGLVRGEVTAINLAVNHVGEEGVTLTDRVDGLGTIVRRIDRRTKEDRRTLREHGEVLASHGALLTEQRDHLVNSVITTSPGGAR